MSLYKTAHCLAQIELGVVGLLVALGVVYFPLLPIALTVGALFWLVRAMAHGRITVRSLADWPLGLLILMLLITACATPLPEITTPQIYSLLSNIVLYYAIVNWTTTLLRVRLVTNGLILTGLILALSAPFTVEWFAETKLLFIPEAIYRALPLLISNPIHPNVLAGALVTLLSCALGWLAFGWQALRRSERWLAVASVLAMATVLVLSKSRGGMTGLSAALLVLVVLRWRRGWLILPLTTLASGLITWQVGLSRVINTLTRTRSIGGIEGRLEIWSRALYIIQDFPFTGVGMGTFEQTVNNWFPFFTISAETHIPHAHNLFLQIAVDLGLPGLCAWLAILLLVIAASWRIYQHGQVITNNLLTGLGVGLVCSQIALVVHGLTDAVTWGTRPAIAVWAIWGLSMATHNAILPIVSPPRCKGME